MTKLARRRILLLLGVGGAAALLAWALRPRPVAVDLAPAARRALAVTLDEEGETRVRARYVVAAPVAGRVLRIALEPGDPVVAGETVLATLLPADPVPLDPRVRSTGEARVAAARAALGQAEARLGEAQAALGLARRELARQEALGAAGITAERDLDAARAAAEGRRDAVAAATFARDAAGHELAAARAALLEPAAGGGGAAGAVTLRSPATGVVLERLRESEAVVAAGTPLVTVGDPTALEIVADFLSPDAVRIAAGQSVLVEQWGEDEPLHGRVRRVEPFGFTRVSALGVEEQRVDVIVELTDPAERWRRLGDGYRVTVRVVVWQDEDVLTVPASSLFRNEGRWQLFVAEGREARLRSVEVGQVNEALAEITGGLEAGERVVAYPSERVADGVRIVARE